MRPTGPPALIGITGRRLPGTRLNGIQPRYQERDIDMYFSDYARSVAAAGGLPVQLPYEFDPAQVAGRLDGLVITGGEDIAPERWGGGPGDAHGDTDPRRDQFELDLVSAAQERGIPLLGICRGMQLINVARGGSLVADLPAEPLDHRNPANSVEHGAHPVAITEGSIAASIYGSGVVVNSLHHQAVRELGEGVDVTGLAPDGVPEIIEVPGMPVVGVQWHPEWMPHADPIFAWLVGRSAERMAVSS